MQTGWIKGLKMAAVLMVFLVAIASLSGASSTTDQLVTDITISDAVEDELFLDASIRAHLINVSTMEGVVTLSGSVDNLLAKQRAERIAETVKGVRAVVNTIKVLPPILRSDSEIKADVKGALLADPATDSFDIDVKVNDNVVTLTGSVSSWQEREIAAKVAMGVKGVKNLRNDLVFTYTSNRPDNDIQQDVNQTLRWDVLVDHALIDVDVTDGRVTLSGTVGSLAEKHRAIDDAYVANVTEVDAEKLAVRLWARDPQLRMNKYKNVSDEKIREAINDALFYDPRVSFFAVTPQVSNGVVTLRGTVDNLKASRAAYQTASSTVGVARVVNRIKVRPTQIIGDEKLKTQIEEAFTRDPIVESFEISVHVRNGVADLFGSVGTFFEKNQAEDLASRVNGVIAVNNYLKVNAVRPPSIFNPFLDDWHFTRDFAPLYGPPLRLVRSDAQIESDIEDQLFWSPFVNADGIHVSVENGHVTLTGTVDSQREFDAATENAYQGGAAAVDNRLIVR